MKKTENARMMGGCRERGAGEERRERSIAGERKNMNEKILIKRENECGTREAAFAACECVQVQEAAGWAKL